MCQDCGLLLLNPQPSDEELDAIYGPEYFLGNSLENGTDHQSRLKQATAVNYLNLLGRYRGASGGELLEVGPGQGDFLAAAASQGYNVTGLEYSSSACDVIKSNLQGQVSIRPPITDGCQSINGCTLFTGAAACFPGMSDCLIS
ncbi:MAG: hypothetical protein HQK56_01440 [Deltaproteobacteria bacterium]|nr:hypothetical protein [Deltaproteobacteria bacterium]